MNILIQLGHPAHFHLFKHTIESLKKDGHIVHVLIKSKDILEDLLSNSGIGYLNILPEGRKNSKLGLLIGMLKRDWRIFKYARKRKIDILTGSTAEIAHVGKILGIPSIYLGEDDASYVKTFCRLTFPYVKEIIQPKACNAGQWEEKAIKYSGYQKLAYLHPNYFKPSKELIPKIDFSKPYYLIRLVSLGAYHDENRKGFSNNILIKLIDILTPHGNVYISSEKELPPHLQQYTLPIDIQNIHHALYFSDLYIGDSQSMAVESAILGVPNIKYNDFAGKIGVLDELEHKYGLTFGIKTNDAEKLFVKVQELISTKNIREIFQDKRKLMLAEKIDVTAFLVWFFENYPESRKIMKENPDYQERFK